MTRRDPEAKFLDASAKSLTKRNLTQKVGVNRENKIKKHQLRVYLPSAVPLSRIFTGLEKSTGARTSLPSMASLAMK